MIEYWTDLESVTVPTADLYRNRLLPDKSRRRCLRLRPKLFEAELQRHPE